MVQKLAARVAALEQKLNSMPSAVSTTAVVGAPVPSQEGPPSPPPQAASAAANTPATPSTTPDFLAGTTLNLMLDGYYAYNFNRPIGRVNLLRAYDVSSNSFSLNQATVVIERTPDLKLTAAMACESICSMARQRKPRREILRTSCGRRFTGLCGRYMGPMSSR